jgi:hypothetical protein
LVTSHLDLKSGSRINGFLGFYKVKPTVTAFNFLALFVTAPLAIPLALTSGSRDCVSPIITVIASIVCNS